MKTYISQFPFFIAMLLTGFSPFKSDAQLIDNKNGKVFTDHPYFNEEIIRKRAIRSISGEQIHYKLGDKPRETDHFKSFVFNQKGQLVERYESVELTKKADTLVTYFDYDDKGNITGIRKRDSYGNYAYFYDYDEKGRVIKEEFRQELSSFPIKNRDFILGERFVISSEKSTYEDFDGVQKRILYSNNNHPYKSIVTHFNGKGLITLETERIDRLPGEKTTRFYYDKRNRLDSMVINSNLSGSQDRTFIFAYDKLGNLVKREEFKNGKYILQYQVLYDEETLLIDDVLEQQISMDFIKVLELRNYTYF